MFIKYLNNSRINIFFNNFYLKLPSLFICIHFFSNCNHTSQGIDNQNISENKNITFLALGDSYTIGEGVKKEENWPFLLLQNANKDNFKIDEPIIIAKTGWTTDELKKGIQEYNFKNKTFDFVSLLIGVNNQYRGRSIGEFEMEFENLLDTAITFAKNDNNKVMVVSIPDYGVTPFAKDRDTEKISNEILAINSVCEEISKKKNVKFLNITDISKEAHNNSKLLASDLLHPSKLMYERWVNEVIYPHFKQKLLEIEKK